MDDFILTRRSVRKFDLTKKIPDDVLLDLCRYAEAAPSARRQDSREYIIVTNQELINKLSLVSKGSMILSECNALIAVVAKNPKDLPTPHMQAMDLSAATENILLAARAMNIGSCWIGIYPLEDRITICNEILKVKSDCNTFSLIALGYPSNPDAFFDANKFNASSVSFRR